MISRWRRVLCVLMLPVLAVPVTYAETGRLFDSVAVFAGQGADHNLKQLPDRILTGPLLWEKSYFNSLSGRKAFGPLGQNWQALRGTPLAALIQGYEVVLVQHHGMQDNAEAGAAYTLKTGDLALGLLAVNFATGVGLSYALGTPTYEDGPLDEPDKRYRLQLLLLFDLEWRLQGVDALSLVMRVHHRSGAYGLIAPPHVGSNFLAAGVRYHF
jgi:hypothetical protein